MAANSSLSRKLHKVLEIRTDHEDLLQSLDDLQGFYGKNSLEARRNLRGLIEKRGLEVNTEFLNLFMSLQKQLEEVQCDVSQMKKCCDEMKTRLQNTRDISGKLILQADKLNQQRKRNEICQEISQNFLSRFQLTEPEIQALKSNEITTSFFKALQRVHQIHDDAKILLRTNHQRAGLEILDAMCMHEEAAYGRLYRWIRNECRKFDSNDGSSSVNPAYIDVSSLIKESIAALKERPVLLRRCLDEIAASRNKGVVKSFLMALTQGGPNGTPRPIELHAHDPIRYIGDMLAWIHQAVATELELLHSLLEGIAVSVSDSTQSYFAKIKPSQSNSNISALSLSRSESEDAINALPTIDITKVLDGTMEGVAKPFKLRVEEVLCSKPGPGAVVIYRISNLLDFYHRTISRVMGVDGTLPKCLVECKHDSMRVFYDLLKEQGDRFQRAPPLPLSSLAPPHQIYEAINRLIDIMKIFDSSLVPFEEREAEFRPILSAVLDPLIHACTLSATRLSVSDMAVYMINCLSVMQHSLSFYDFASSRVENLGAHIKAHMDTLVQEQASIILQNCGLAHKISIIQKHDGQTPLSKVTFMDSKSILDTMRAFEGMLLDPGALLMPQCDRLINGQLRTFARNSVANVIYDSFLFFHNAISDPQNQYENPDSLFTYKPDQVRVMVDAL